MVTHPYLVPQKKPPTIKKPKKLKVNTSSKDFYRFAAALANPDFADLPLADRQTIRGALVARTTKSR